MRVAFWVGLAYCLFCYYGVLFVRRNALWRLK